MAEDPNHLKNEIPEELILARLEQSEQMREFFIQMWLQNPHLAENLPERLKAMLRPLEYTTSTSDFLSDSEMERLRGIRERGNEE